MRRNPCIVAHLIRPLARGPIRSDPRPAVHAVATNLNKQRIMRLGRDGLRVSVFRCFGVRWTDTEQPATGWRSAANQGSTEHRYLRAAATKQMSCTIVTVQLSKEKGLKKVKKLQKLKQKSLYNKVQPGASDSAASFLPIYCCEVVLRGVFICQCAVSFAIAI